MDILDPRVDLPETPTISRGRLAFMMLAAAGLVVIAMFAFTQLRANGAFLSSLVRWKRTTFELDLDGDGALDTLELGAKSLTVTDAKGVTAHVPTDWLVADADSGDIEGDGRVELVLLVWSKESVDTSQSSETQVKATKLIQRIYIVRYYDAAFERVWVSRNIPDKTVSLRVDAEGHVHTVMADDTEFEWKWIGSELVQLDK